MPRSPTGAANDQAAHPRRPCGSQARGGLGNPELAARQAADAAERDEVLRPVLAELANLSARAIAAELNARKIPTPRGGVWHAETVIRVQRRLKD